VPLEELSAAIAIHQSGDLTRAEVLYRKVLARYPDQPIALSKLGVLMLQKGDERTAIDLILRAVEVSPDKAELRYALAQVSSHLKDLASAQEHYCKLLELAPDFAEGYVSFGLVLRELNNLQGAGQAFERALQLQPGLVSALHNLADLHREFGQQQMALDLYNRAILLEPENASAYYNRGCVLEKMGQKTNALDSYLQAVKLKPDFAEAYLNLVSLQGARGESDRAYGNDRADESMRIFEVGNSAYYRGEFENAAKAFEAWLASNPNRAEGYLNVGICYERLGDLFEQRRIYEAGIAACPHDARLYHQLGRIVRDEGKYPSAIEYFQQAIELNPNLAEAYSELSAIEASVGSCEIAADLSKRSVELNPNSDEAVAAHRMQHVCRFEDAEHLGQRAVEHVMQRDDPAYSAHPFAFLCLPNAPSPREQYRCAQRWAKLHNYDVRRSLVGFRSHDTKHRSSNKLRIGYMSADFHDHATSWLIAEMLEEHDRSDFEIFLYSFGPDDGTEIRRRIVESADIFRECRSMRHPETASIIAQDEVDILVDLKGYTRNSRFEVLTYKPAPIQVNYLGYPGTLGVDTIDYILVDSYVVPPDQQPYYSEKLVHLPCCYQVNDSRVVVADWTPTRSECGLPEDAVVCCSFNTPFKLTTSMLKLWLRVLQHQPNSVLWLLDERRVVGDRVLPIARDYGIDPKRIIFADRIEHSRHLARLKLADLFFDSFPVNGHTTVSDMLRMGVPALTLSGESFVSRVAGSLLFHLGMSELIAHSFVEYETKAMELVAKPETLYAVRQKLRKCLHETDLFDGRAFARRIESAYRAMWNVYRIERQLSE
jgi:predicted O-linked N-acetylglucosamine transferase (SPINDLY family)